MASVSSIRVTFRSTSLRRRYTSSKLSRIARPIGRTGPAMHPPRTRAAAAGARPHRRLHRTEPRGAGKGALPLQAGRPGPGLERGGQPAQSEYSNLAPGNYRFRVTPPITAACGTSRRGSGFHHRARLLPDELVPRAVRGRCFRSFWRLIDFVFGDCGSRKGNFGKRSRQFRPWPSPLCPMAPRLRQPTLGGIYGVNHRANRRLRLAGRSSPGRPKAGSGEMASLGGDRRAVGVEARFHRADGQYRWFLARAVPLRDAEARFSNGTVSRPTLKIASKPNKDSGNCWSRRPMRSWW